MCEHCEAEYTEPLELDEDGRMDNHTLCLECRERVCDEHGVVGCVECEGV